MRIVSKQHDYYDSVQGYGHENDGVVYVRKLLAEQFEHGGGGSYRNSKYLTLHEHLIGFCGQYFHAIQVSVHAIIKPTWCFSTEQVDEIVAKLDKKCQTYYYAQSKYNHDYWSDPAIKSVAECRLDVAESDRRRALERFFTKRQRYEFECTAAQPVLVVDYSSRTVYYNPLLRPYEFYRVKDTYTAFQELSTYLGAYARPEKPIPHVSDADMLAAKGFDPKYSFRKEPKQPLKFRHRKKPCN